MSGSDKIFWLLAFVLLLLGVGARQVAQLELGVDQALYKVRFEKRLQKAAKLAVVVLDKAAENKTQEKEKLFEELRHEIEGTPLGLFAYDGHELELWNNIEALPPFYFREFYRPTFISTENGSYLFFVRGLGDDFWVVSVPLNHHYSYANKYLQENAPLLEGFSKYYNLGAPGKYETAINLESGQAVCSITEKLVESHLVGFKYSLYLVILLLAVLSVRNKSYLQLSVSVVIYLVVRHGYWSTGFNTLPFFSPALYSGVTGISGLGDLIAVCILLFASFSLVRQTHSFDTLKKLKSYLSLTILFFVAYDIEVNSLICIETQNLLDLDIWSLCVYAFFALLLYNSVSDWMAFDLKQDSLVATLVIVLFAAGIIIFDTGLFILIVPVSRWILGGVLHILNTSGRSYQLTFLTLFSITLFLSIEYTAAAQRQRKLPIEVKNLVNQRDQVAEFLLNDFRNGVSSDQYIKSFFINPFIPQSAVKERIQQLYLRGYLRKFDHDILFLPRKIKFGYQPDHELARRINEIVTYQSEQVSPGVFASSLSNINNAYVTRQYYLQDEDTIGSLYILLKEKAFYDQSIYPELLIGHENHTGSGIDLSYAVYDHGALIFAKGDVDYQRTVDLVDNDLSENLSNQFHHHQYRPNEQMLYVLSIKKRALFSYLSAFSVFVFALLIPFLTTLLIYRAKSIRERVLSKSLTPKLSTKIRVVTMASVFLALLILGYATAVYTQNEYESQSMDFLLSKLKKAELYFSEIANSSPESFGKSDKIQDAVHQFSELYQADIDVFRPNGSLLASSQKLLYENGILEAQVDGAAHFEIMHREKSRFVNIEKVGLLKYSCAFAPIIYNDQAVALIQLPYFSRQRDVKQDLASFFVTLFNIYLILIALLGFLTAFLVRNLTRPLNLISSQLSKTSLLGYNQKLAWSNDDEIGALVREYNEMIDKLDESARQLAESKQAEAWQEMARQVAHEIKNPLTPMKLNIQQLKRAWNDQRPDLDKIFDRVTGILVNQIDLLSRIASEFSSFAKMPSLQLAKVDLIAILHNVALLNNPNSKVVAITTEHSKIEISGDEDQLFRAINNIVKNGIQAVPSERTPLISIAVKVDGSDVLLSISDNGSGIGPSQHDKIFMPNFSTKSSGMGLGLAIVKQIIDNHNGEVWFESNNEVGTTFYISMPLVGVY